MAAHGVCNVITFPAMVERNCDVPLTQAVCKGGAEVVLACFEVDADVGSWKLVFTLGAVGVGIAPKGFVELVLFVGVCEELLLVVEDADEIDNGLFEGANVDEVDADDDVDNVDADDGDRDEEELLVVDDTVDDVFDVVDCEEVAVVVDNVDVEDRLVRDERVEDEVVEDELAEEAEDEAGVLTDIELVVV